MTINLKKYFYLLETTDCSRLLQKNIMELKISNTKIEDTELTDTTYFCERFFHKDRRK